MKGGIGNIFLVVCGCACLSLLSIQLQLRITNVAAPNALTDLITNKIDGTNVGPTRTEGSLHATVMGMASGYGVVTYRNFVGTLRRSGFEGNIILAISPDPKPGVLEYLNGQNVTIKRLDFVKCDYDLSGEMEVNATLERNEHVVEQHTCVRSYPKIKLRWSRFPLLKDYLMECEDCTGPVLVCDVRDTFFQRDPFGVGAPDVEGLQVFQEHKTMTTANWITQFPIQDCKGIDFAKEPYVNPMLCSGTTVGTRDAMLLYLTAMYDEMKVWMSDTKCCCNKMNGDDQSIHNYLFYTGRLPYARAISNRMGIVHTAGVQGSKILEGHAKHLIENAGIERTAAMKIRYAGANGMDQWIGPQFDLIDEKGFFTDYDGGRSRVVHQYDRFGQVFKNERGKLFKHLHSQDN